MVLESIILLIFFPKNISYAKLQIFWEKPVFHYFKSIITTFEIGLNFL